MSSVAIVIGLSLALIIGGLLIAFLSPSAGRASSLFWWVGVVLAVLGLILLVAPVISWIAAQIHAVLGAG